MWHICNCRILVGSELDVTTFIDLQSCKTYEISYINGKLKSALTSGGESSPSRNSSSLMIHLQNKTGFNGAETNCRIARNLGILLMNSNCFVIFRYVFIRILQDHWILPGKWKWRCCGHKYLLVLISVMLSWT